VAAAGRDGSSLAFVLRTAVTVADTAETEQLALDRGKNLLALVAALPGMDRPSRAAGFDVPALLDEVRTAMRTEETLASGGGFPALRRDGDLAAARKIIPDELIRRLGIIGPLPVVRERLQVLAALGVTHVGVAPPPNPTSEEAWRRLLANLGE